MASAPSKNRCMYALVASNQWFGLDPTYTIEHKNVLKILIRLQDMTIVCDDQPLSVLRGMLKLLEEKK